VPAKKTKTKSASKKKAAAKASTPAKKKSSSVNKKTPAKKASLKKTVAKKKAPAKTKQAAKKKASVKKTPSKKVSGKKKPAAKKTATKKKAAPKKPTGKVPVPRGKRPTPNSRNGDDDFYDEPVKPKVKPMNKRDLKKFKKILLDLRDRLQGDITFLTTDNLHRAGRETGADLSGAAQHSADHGTDNFDREFALSLASAEQDVMYEVDEALMRIEEGTYGICEHTGVLIEPARLEVIPYTRYSVQAQAKMEQSRAGYRPFGQSFKKW
jgi:RNA polymerase-binding transcription factor DksA